MAGAPSQATLTIKSGPHASRVVDLPEGELLIGRIEPAGLTINDSEVSRQHARLNYRQARYFLEDLGSVNGTLINGARITGQRMLANGDEIMLGLKIILVFHQPQLRPDAIREVVATRLEGVLVDLIYDALSYPHADK